MAELRLRLLGPLRVWDGTAWSPVPAAQQRLVLAILAIEIGRMVATDRLVDEIWGDRPPRAATSVVRGYIMRLRRQLGGDRHGPLVTGSAGYMLTTGPDEVDAYVFDGLSAAGRKALSAGDRRTAVARLTDALAMWDGPALADVPPAPPVIAQARRWEEERLTAREDWLGAHVDLGLHLDVLSELHEFVDDHPLRERCWAHLMRALYRSGRRAEALEAFQRARRAIVAELGLEPGTELRLVQQAILADNLNETNDNPVARIHLQTHSLVPAQLPPDTAGFAGRQSSLRRLDEALQRDSVVCLVGMAGVGKTALAVHWGHRVADRFPDGQLYVNLRGFDPTGTAVNPADAIRQLLDALQVPAERVPADPAASEGLYRSLMAGRRILLVLDNARDAGQVRPLLPGAAGCLALVTSRDDLSGLVIGEGARLVALEPMSAAEARRLLANRLGAQRLAAEESAVEEIVARCARLPLALSIVAARAVARPGFPLRVVAEQLRGLDAFASGDPATDTRTVFSWSYRTLSLSAARLFRLLALPHGPDIGAAAAASLAALPPGLTAADTVNVTADVTADVTAAVDVRIAVGAPLAELTRASLLVEHAPGRYAMHDLIREYARELLQEVDQPHDRRAALHRLLDHYLHTAHAAFLHTDPLGEPLALAAPQPGTSPEQICDGPAAQAWFVAEHRNVLAIARQAQAHGFEVHTWQLAWTLDGFHGRQGHWQDQLAAQRAALAAGLTLGDQTAQAYANRGLGNVSVQLGRYEQAHHHYELAARLYAATADRVAEARMHSLLGRLLSRQDRHREALVHKRFALEFYHAAGHPAGQARTLNQLGWSYLALGEYQQAVEHCRQAITLAQAAGDRHGEALAWDSLGYAYHHLDRYNEAAAGFSRALALQRGVGDRYNEADTLVHLGETLAATGRTDAAHDTWRQALSIMDDLEHPQAAAVAARLPLAGLRR